MNRSWLAIITIAIIWAAVILATSIRLEEDGCQQPVLHILGGGAAASIILLGGLFRKEARP